MFPMHRLYPNKKTKFEGQSIFIILQIQALRKKMSLFKNFKINLVFRVSGPKKL